MNNLHKIQPFYLPEEIHLVAANWQGLNSKKKPLRYYVAQKKLMWYSGDDRWAVFPPEHYKYWNKPNTKVPVVEILP
jgi:hypothetical protein